MNLHVDSWYLYEKAMQEVMVKVAVDAGANDGGYTKTLLSHGFEVHAFEPVPAMFAEMKVAHGENPKAHLNMLGLSDKAEVLRDVTVLEAWTIGQVGMGGLNIKPEMKDAKPFDMQTITLDSYLDGDPIGLFKLDVDGYEFKVLLGAEKTLRKWHPPILCEFGKYLAAVGDDPKTFVEFIFDLGYDIWSMDGKFKATMWNVVQPHWPIDTYDVMLLPKL